MPVYIAEMISEHVRTPATAGPAHTGPRAERPADIAAQWFGKILRTQADDNILLLRRSTSDLPRP